MGKRSRRLFAALASALAVFVVSTTAALAYLSGSVGYDVSYPQCGSAGVAPVLSPVPAASVAAPAEATASPAGAASAGASPSSSFMSRSGAPPSASSTAFRSRGYAFGIIGVDSGTPFTTTAPGNPCLGKEYAAAPNPGLYVNTGYDPSYLDSSHTTTDCKTQSAGVSGSSAQQAAWAVGCSEAESDYSYAQAQGTTSAPGGWWLDVETGNSWCGQPGTSCSDPSLNVYTLQGLIDTFSHIGAVPVGIYSNRTMWTAIVGTGKVTGATADWVASGTATAQDAALQCSSAFSFSGSPVQLVQFVAGNADRDYAC